MTFLMKLDEFREQMCCFEEKYDVFWLIGINMTEGVNAEGIVVSVLVNVLHQPLRANRLLAAIGESKFDLET